MYFMLASNQPANSISESIDRPIYTKLSIREFLWFHHRHEDPPAPSSRLPRWTDPATTPPFVFPEFHLKLPFFRSPSPTALQMNPSITTAASYSFRPRVFCISTAAIRHPPFSLYITCPRDEKPLRARNILTTRLAYNI